MKKQPSTLYYLDIYSLLSVDVVKTVASLARVQSFLSRYATSKALELFDIMPEFCSTTPLAREILARIFFEKLDYSKTKEVLERLHLDFPHRLAGMEVSERKKNRNGIYFSISFSCIFIACFYFRIFFC